MTEVALAVIVRSPWSKTTRVDNGTAHVTTTVAWASWPNAAVNPDTSTCTIGLSPRSLRPCLGLTAGA